MDQSIMTVAVTWRYSILFCLCSIFSLCNATCSSTPALPSNAYSLTQDKTVYAINDVYTIVCLPGFTLMGETDLSCTATGSWSDSPPTCSPNEGKYSWWMLLIGVVGVIILVPCILPRLIFCCCNKKNKEKDDYGGNFSYKGRSDGGGTWRSGKEKPITPITSAGKHKLSQIDRYPYY